MKNKNQITKLLKTLNNDVELTNDDVKELFDLIKRSDDKETNDDYKNHMVRAKNELTTPDEYSAFKALHEINQALLVVGIKYY